MRCHVRFVLAIAAGVLMCAEHSQIVDAAERTAKKQPAQTVELFKGMQDGNLDVRFVAHNDREAQIIIKNKTKQPLSVKLPEAFAAMPVLAQNNNNNRNNNNNNQNQSIGGGFGGGGFGGGGLGGGGFGGGFNVAPEGVGKLKVPVMCLEHGKADPNVRIPYEIKPIDSYTEDARVQELLVMFGEGKLNHRAAQAAVWHLANGMSWAELAAKKINRLGRPDEPYFSAAELQLAAQIATQAENLAKARPAAPKSDSKAGETRGKSGETRGGSESLIDVSEG